MKKVKLMTKAIELKAPALYATEGVPNDEKVIIASIFDPCGRFTFYMVEYNPTTRIAFGYTISPLGPDCDEWGYSDLNELDAVRNSWGLPLERDYSFDLRGKTIGQVVA